MQLGQVRAIVTRAASGLGQLAEETRNSLIAGIPLQRIGTPYEMWLALRFIIECDYFTGRVIEVDGGSTF